VGKQREPGKRGRLCVNSWQVSTLDWPCPALAAYSWLHLLFELHFHLFSWVRALCAALCMCVCVCAWGSKCSHWSRTRGHRDHSPAPGVAGDTHTGRTHTLCTLWGFPGQPVIVCECVSVRERQLEEVATIGTRGSWTAAKETMGPGGRLRDPFLSARVCFCVHLCWRRWLRSQGSCCMIRLSEPCYTQCVRVCVCVHECESLHHWLESGCRLWGWRAQMPPAGRLGSRDSYWAD